MLAACPPDQAERLAAVRAYGALDGAVDPDFDAITTLVARLLDVPIALVSLVDEDHQWFLARRGITLAGTPLEQSICAHAMAEKDVLEIEDTLADPRTADNPLCCGPLLQMRFYAGAPLVTPRGQTIGTLCVLDDRPRRLSDGERETLRVLAQQVMRLMELGRTLAIEQSLRAEIDHRTKNSMQSVLSFIRLYKRTGSQETQTVLDAISRRVEAVAGLHKALYHSPTDGQVKLDSFFAVVAELLQEQAPADVTIALDIAPVEVPPDAANALVIIVNEFVANSFKHAYRNGGPGQIDVALSQANRSLTLRCADSGPSDTAANMDRQIQPVAASRGIGMRLMEAAARQVRGTLTVGATDAGYCLQLSALQEPDLFRRQPEGETAA